MYSPQADEVVVTQDIGPEFSARWRGIKEMQAQVDQSDTKLREVFSKMTPAQKFRFAKVLMAHGEPGDVGIVVKGAAARAISLMFPSLSTKEFIQRGRLMKRLKGTTYLFWADVEDAFIKDEDADLAMREHQEGGQTRYALTRSKLGGELGHESGHGPGCACGAPEKKPSAFERLWEGVMEEDES